MNCITIHNYSEFLVSYAAGSIAYESVEFGTELDEFLQDDCHISTSKLAIARTSVLRTVMTCRLTNGNHKMPCIFQLEDGAILMYVATTIVDGVLRAVISRPRKDIGYCDLS